MSHGKVLIKLSLLLFGIAYGIIVLKKTPNIVNRDCVCVIQASWRRVEKFSFANQYIGVADFMISAFNVVV